MTSTRNQLTGMVIIACVLIYISPFATGCLAESGPLAKIIVEARLYKRVDTPVCISLADVTDKSICLREVRSDSREAVPSQIEAGDCPKLWWILSGTTEPGAKRVYELVKEPCSQAMVMEVSKNDKYLEIMQGDTRVLRYNHAIVPAPNGHSSLYNRSGFIHPLWSPSGVVLTNIHPEDHIHHMGIWMPWTHTEFEGKPVDFWNLDDGQGTVRFVKFLSTSSGPVYGGFEAEQEHVALNTAEGEKVVLREIWDVRVYNVGGPEKGYWLWDFVSRQTCVADSPLKQKEYRYGGLGYRGPAQWDEENSVYLTSEGKNRKNGHATRARWCDMAGRINSKWQGVTVMSHPKNFRHPEPMRIWPEGQVFFNFAPGLAGDWVMEPGKEGVFRYRFYVHEGKLDADKIEGFWRDYAEPPEVKMEVFK